MKVFTLFSLALILIYFIFSFNKKSLDAEDIEYRKDFFAKHRDAVYAVVFNNNGKENHYLVTDSAIINGCLIGKFYSAFNPQKAKEARFKRMTVCSDFQISE